MNRVVYRSYAKINLYLDVLDRRPDGYTNIETVFQTVDLCDELHFEACSGGIRVTCSDPALGNAQDNLVYRAAVLLRSRTGASGAVNPADLPGVHIHLEKRIPIAAGLAGGSGNAAATLVALNTLWALGLRQADLATLALELGSDVPYCLAGGTAAATGRGEVLEILPPLAPTWLVLVHPPLAITAGQAYSHPRLTRNLTTPVGGKTPAFRDALERLSANGAAGVVFNRMESGVFHEFPALAEIKTRLMEYGCSVAAMSGSGPTVFGLCASEAIARETGRRIDDYRVSVIQTATRGVACCA